MDKETALVDGKTVVLTIDDLQAVLLTPAMAWSSVLQNKAITVHDMTSKNVCCYFWHESEGELNNIDVNIIIFNNGADTTIET